MFGVRYIKAQPTTYLMQFHKGQLVRQGAGLSFFYYAPASTLVAVPMASQEAGFMLELVTGDFQAVTVQGEVSFRVGDPKRTVALMDFSLRSNGKHASEDAERLRERVVVQAKVIIQQAIQALDLRDALRAPARIARETQAQLGAQAEVQALGLEILGVSIVAIKPTQDIARALEAEAREANLKAADDAIYQRRMAAVENERSIRQNELDTEVAVEEKQRDIQAARMDAQAALVQRENALRREQMTADVELEQSRKELVTSQAENTRALAEAEAHRVRAIMTALDQADPRVVQALAAVGMQPGQLIAQAFGGLAERAERIGQLNVSPELLSGLLGDAAPAAATAAGSRRAR
ncbi:SPFH domain-containing protein [Corticibacter populi]|uniref:SPFH domain-containing protein n=1 Tax=Corticibacter populi TaxID=1550736 RepID=A0A3M6QNL9_9BURK|nr:SPFH domain-containing protein [Corticibacter populi]RMX04351.1 SPFH domain-containing protein [Corticibacter populi]RZS33342.1 SPFH domain/Band 7 family protein [Corticibacter populi]